uniref:Peptide chain release factor domain-containing protein n=1 Tax=Biomphalaria glabrata TaxID=6526 RepID=A0A2C9JSR3_BIOGL
MVSWLTQAKLIIYSLLHEKKSTNFYYGLPIWRPFANPTYSASLLPSFVQGLITADSRKTHTSTKFTIENPIYVSFLKSLVEEYNAAINANVDYVADADKRQRFNFLKLVTQSIQELEKKQGEVLELQSMMAEEDKEMKLLVDKEIIRLKKEVQIIEKELIDILVGEDSADNKDIVMEICAGVGGQEAMLFCAELFLMYRNYAHFKGWTVTGLSIEENEIGGTRKAVIEINGESVFKHLKYEAGVHRVQRVPKTEKAGRIHTSTVTVSVLPQPSEVDIDIQPNELRIETFRCSGPGGQHVNKTDSAVRIIHLPTGTVSECRQERSQIKNKETAMKNLKIKLYQAILEEEDKKRQATRKLQIGSKGRSEKIRTYNFQQDRITDHRSKEDFSNLPDFMLGGQGLDDLVLSLHQFEKLQLLESMLDSYTTEISRTKTTKGS